MTKKKYTEEQLISAVKQANSYREVGRILGFDKSASHLNKEIDRLKLDTTHFIKSTKKGQTKYDAWIDEEFGKLTIVDIIPPDKTSKSSWSRKIYKFNCKCKCGKYRIYPTSYFKRGLSLSCGCDKSFYDKISGPNSKRYTGYEEISGTYWNRIIERCSSRNYEIDVTIEDIWNLFLEQGRKCFLSGQLLQFGTNITASLDRINSNKGYIKGNLQWIHKDINRMKSDFSEQYFLEICQKIVSYQNET